MRSSCKSFLALLGMFIAGSAQAGYEFRFADASGTFSNSFSFDATVTPTIDIRVYLLATAGDADGNKIDDITDLTTTGLASSGVKLTYGGTVAKVTGVTPNGSFDDTLTATGGASEAILRQTIDENAAVKVPTVGPTANAVLLGTFTFTGLSVGSEFVLTVDPDSGKISNNVLDDGTALDAFLANASASITVTAIPEPGSLILCGLFASGIATGAYRRYRRKAAA